LAAPSKTGAGTVLLVRRTTPLTHFQRLAHDALDQVRCALVAKHTEPEQRHVLEQTRFVLQKNPENLSSAERQKLAVVQANNRSLCRAYLLKDTLASILGRRQYYVAADLIAERRFDPAGFRLPLGLKDMELALAAGKDLAVP